MQAEEFPASTAGYEDSVQAAPLLKEYRGGYLENLHCGHIAGVDANGSVRCSAGDPEWATFMRSAAKPFQALPFFLEGMAERFGFTPEEQTLLMASHRAMPYHVEALESMMRKLGLSEEAFACKPTYPLDASARDEIAAARGPARAVYHNCSGKHLGLLAYCLGMGLPLESYASPDHPVQVRIVRILSELAGLPGREIRLATDGCGLPVFGMPLRHMAQAFLKLACPDLIEDAALRAAATRVAERMNAYPNMISAPYLICPNLLADPNIVAKGGAKGVYCFALKRERLAFALKVIDGSEEEWPLIVASILEQIGYGNADTIARMYRIGGRVIRNDNGAAVGENKAVFSLKMGT
ncbi:asparaginase [Cohnella hongkongensis]|uniref:Asparaginase n=1 Tax=Cohnella hongkongensis TaxID=178337 RepID=A0ABV9FF70_9BACL